MFGPGRQLRLIAAMILVALALGLGCAVNPLTGKRELALLSEPEEIRLGQELDQRVTEAVGLYPDEAVAARVSALGQELAAHSERSSLDWTFRVLDDPAVNAFALPGGFVYVTRGLLTHLNSEAQLAAVLGHEIGHVSARHSVNQISRAAVASSGAGFLRIIDPSGAHVRGAAQRGVEDLILRHSREDEFEADELGLRYLERAQLDPRAMVEVLRSIERITVAAAPRGIPTSQSTHPDPELRRARLEQEVGAPTGLAQDRAYLQLIEGMLFGANAREGFMDGSRLVHPQFGVQLDFPFDWEWRHDAEAALALSPTGDALLYFSAGEGPSAEEGHARFFANTGFTPGESWVEELAGMPVVSSWFAVSEGQVELVGIAAFVQGSSRTFGLLALVPSERAEELGPVLETSLRSFGPITRPEHRDVQPMRVRVVELGAATSLTVFVDRHPSSVGRGTLAIVNQVELDALLPAGTLIKTVAGFNPETKESAAQVAGPAARTGELRTIAEPSATGTL